jgi:hypothetical protein
MLAVRFACGMGTSGRAESRKGEGSSRCVTRAVDGRGGKMHRKGRTLAEDTRATDVAAMSLGHVSDDRQSKSRAARPTVPAVAGAEEAGEDLVDLVAGYADAGVRYLKHHVGVPSAQHHMRLVSVIAEAHGVRQQGVDDESELVRGTCH